MDYLYIPTTTLNFNNILSTGSISPVTVYAARKFGYKQFEVVEPNPFKNVLLLYSRYPEFTIEDADRDSHPLVLRIPYNHLPRTLKKHFCHKADVTIYSCDQTIYFAPASVDIFFSSPSARQTALAKSEPSLTTKLVELYQPLIRVPQPGEVDAFEWSDKILEGILDGDREETLRSCDVDDRINRLKGFACGYIIGAYNSVDANISRLRSNFRVLRNEISALLNDPSRKHSETLHRDIEFSCKTLEQFFSKVDVGGQRFSPDQGDEIGIANGKITDIRDRYQTISRATLSLVDLINDYCLISEFRGQLDEERLDVAIAGAKIIRSLIGTQWDSCPHKQYINALLNNIKSGSAFDFDDSKSHAMQSFAAFVMKGDDLEKLEAFLTAHGIGDFRMAFSLWGAMFGFSKIPKTFYNIPFQHGDTAYASKIFAYIHSIVHGLPLIELEKPTILDKENLLGDTVASNKKSSEALLDQLHKQLPGSMPWRKKLYELLDACHGLTTEFIKKLRGMKVNYLGPKPGKGTNKKAVVGFFMDAFNSQQSASLKFLFPAESPQTIKFWDDPQAWEFIQQAVPYKDQRRFMETLKWFQREWKDPNSKYYGWLNEEAMGTIRKKPLEERTNYDAIEAFCGVLNRNGDLCNGPLDNVRSLLLTRYPN